MKGKKRSRAASGVIFTEVTINSETINSETRCQDRKWALTGKEKKETKIKKPLLQSAVYTTVQVHVLRFHTN